MQDASVQIRAQKHRYTWEAWHYKEPLQRLLTSQIRTPLMSRTKSKAHDASFNIKFGTGWTNDAWMMLDFPGPRHSRFSLRCRGGVQLEQPGGEQVDGDDISIMYMLYSIKISYIYIHDYTRIYTNFIWLSWHTYIYIRIYIYICNDNIILFL